MDGERQFFEIPIGITIFWGKPFLGESHFWGKAIFWGKPFFWGNPCGEEKNGDINWDINGLLDIPSGNFDSVRSGQSPC